MSDKFAGRWRWCSVCNEPIIACLDESCYGTSCNGSGCEKCLPEFDEVARLICDGMVPTKAEVEAGFKAGD